MKNTAILKPIEMDTVPINMEIDPSEFPKNQLTATGKVSLNGSIDNVRFMMKKYGITCRYNLITHEDEISIPGKRYTKDNATNCAIQEIISLCINNGIPKGDVVGHIKVIADENSYNPVLEWVTSVDWDGIDRITPMIESIKTTDAYINVRDIYMRKWFMCAMGMLYNGTGDHELEYEGVLVFQGSQGLGKTRWFKSLVPNHLDHISIDGFELDLTNKDSRLTFSSHWLVELGELDSTFKKSEIGSLKAFITMKKDKIRRPYDRVDTTLFRRTTMFASVNDEQFLHDATGNRRFWCLPVQSIEMIEGLDIQQFWAQVHHDLLELGIDSRPWYVTGEDAEKRDKANELFLAADPIEEMLLSMIDMQSKKIEFRGTSTAFAKLTGISNPNRGQIMTAKRVLKEHGCKEVRSSHGRFISTAMPRNVDNVLFKQLGFQRLISGVWSDF